MSEPAPLLALEALYAAVRASMAADAVQCEQPFGWRASARQQGDAPRIVWVPGDAGGTAGDMAPPRKPGRDPRPLFTLNERFHCVISASASPLNPENEAEQYRATRLLFDAWARAVYLAAYGTVTVGAPRWLTSRNESRRGATLIAECTIQAMIPDEEHDHAPADAHADITVTELDHSESFVAPDP